MPPPLFHTYAAKVLRAVRRTDARATEAQRAAGNARVGKVYCHGLELSVEWPRGSTRRGVGKDGKPWSRPMHAHYGYINRTTSPHDGDHVDFYLGDHPESQIVFVISQLDADGNLDEHKCVLGTRNVAEAKKLYLAHYPDWWADERLGEVRGYTMDQFKQWLDTDNPVKNTATKAADFAAENEAARVKDQASHLPHVRDGYIPCPGCQTRYHVMPADQKCPKCSAELRVRLRGKAGHAEKAAGDRFHRPENYDKIRDLPNGRELWAGANDWEAGWTWAWVQKKGADEPEQFLRVDHAACPGCKGTGEDSSAKADSLCVRYGKKRVAEWAAGLSKEAGAGYFCKTCQVFYKGRDPADGCPECRLPAEEKPAAASRPQPAKAATVRALVGLGSRLFGVKAAAPVPPAPPLPPPPPSTPPAASLGYRPPPDAGRPRYHQNAPDPASVAPGAVPGLNSPPLPRPVQLPARNADVHPLTTPTFGAAVGGPGVAAGGLYQHNVFPASNEPTTRPGVFTAAMGPGGEPVGRIPPVVVPAGRKPVLPHWQTLVDAGPTRQLNDVSGAGTGAQSVLGRDAAAEDRLQKFLTTLPADDVGRFAAGLYVPPGQRDPAWGVPAAATASGTVHARLTDSQTGRPLSTADTAADDASAWALFRRMYPNAFAPLTYGAGATIPQMDSAGAYRQPTVTPTVPYPGTSARPTGLTAVHELGHYAQAAPSTFSESTVPAAVLSNPPATIGGRPLGVGLAEIAPTLAGLPAAAEYAKMRQRELGRSVTGLTDTAGAPATIRFANGTEMGIEAMRRAAGAHGLLDGRASVQDLLGTRAGQAWLRQKIESGRGGQ